MNVKLTLAALALSTCTFAVAQEAPIPPTPPSAPHVIVRARAPHAEQRPEVRVIHGGGMKMSSGEMHMGPGGMWWKDSELTQKIGVSADQQKRMDEIFQQTRLQLIDLNANLEKQEILMEPLMSANPPDTNKVLAQIDHTAQARAELEKAHAKMLLGIRGVLTADQWTKLQAEEHSHRKVMNFRVMGDGMGHGEGMGLPGGDHMVRERHEVHIKRNADGTTTTTTSGGPGDSDLDNEFQIAPRS